MLVALTLFVLILTIYSGFKLKSHVSTLIFLFLSTYSVVQMFTFALYDRLDIGRFLKILNLDSKEILLCYYFSFVLHLFFILPVLAQKSRIHDYFPNGNGNFHKVRSNRIGSTLIAISALVHLWIAYKFAGTYLLFVGGSEANFYYNIIAWSCLFNSAGVYFAIPTNKKVSIASVSIGLIIFSLISLKIRIFLPFYGLMFMVIVGYYRLSKSGIILFVLLTFWGLFQSVLRFQSFNFSDYSALFFTLSGEFLIPSLSLPYLLINPIEAPTGNVIDLFALFIPLLDYPDVLSDFRSEYLIHGLDPWPIGGIPLYGQLWFFFGPLSFFITPLISVFLLIADRKMLKKDYRYIIAFSLLVIVLPRQPLWLSFKLLIYFIVIQSLIVFVIWCLSKKRLT